ncbi:MAG: DUF1614 domain-containing protein [Gallionella sp.]
MMTSTPAEQALSLRPANAAPMAFISGTLGVLIGGAGSFDGIFISGIVAVLLA